MELARIIVLEIATLSQRVVSVATEYARCRGFRNIQSCHFRLEKEMQKISVAAGGILGVLSKSFSNGSPLDDRLQDWFSTDEPATCLDTLHQMERMLQDDTWTNAIFSFVNTLRSLPPEDKIDAAVKLFDSRRSYFHFLLTIDVWNREDAQQTARPVHAQDSELLVQPTELLQYHGRTLLNWSFSSAMELDPNNASVPLSMVNGTAIFEEQTKREIDARKLDNILIKLNGLNCAAKQEETLSLRQPDTCTWLHSTPEYKLWSNNNDLFLWLQGKPGSGKTILASFVIDSLKDKRRCGEALAFFYCDFRSERSTSASEVMSSLLSQLLYYMRNENCDSGELVDNLVKEMDSDTTILKNVKRLATLVSQVAKQFSHQPLIVVDAIDECKETKKLIDGILTLAEGGMRLFVTSRPLQAIKDGFYGLPSISMEKMAREVSTDIALHVTRELDSSPRLRALEHRFKTGIHSLLCDRAGGMFRWVQCQIDTLNRCATKAEVREALGNLPVGLDETYRRILVSIDVGSPEGKLAKRALVWLVGSLRPLRLVEILEGLTIDIARQTMNPETSAMHKGVLLYACGSLVTYDEKTDILVLSHFSVKEYLTGDPTRIKLAQYHINYQGAHEHLARTCTCYIALYLKHVHACDENTSQLRIMRTINGRSHGTTKGSGYSENSSTVFSMSQKLLGYVFTYGFHHLSYLGSASRAVLKDMVTLQSHIEHHPAAWEKICRTSQRYKLRIPLPASEHDFMLYVLTAFGSDSLLHTFLGPTRRLLKPRFQTNPLVYAAHFGKPKHAYLLLSRGAKVNERGLAIGAHLRALPLEVAVMRQHDAMVDLLLSSGSVVPEKLFLLTMSYNFPIRVASRLLQTDEFTEWAADQANELPSPGTILKNRPRLECEGDMIMLIRRLVQVGDYGHRLDSTLRAALHFPILGPYDAIVVYLLLIGTPFPPEFISVVSRITSSKRMPMLHLIAETGVTVDARTSSGETMLHFATRYFHDDCLEAVKILVRAGCKPFVRNTAGKTPLHLALEKGSSSVADYLLSQGMPPSDSLLAVLESNCPATWRLATLRALVDGGADIRGITYRADTMSHQAMAAPEEHQRLEMAKFPSVLCDPSGCNTGDRKHLSLVTDHSSSLPEYLLSTRRSPPPASPFSVLGSDLPLAWKALTICSLVEKEIDVRGLSANGNALLHAGLLALDEYQGLDVAKLLVGAGCDPFWRNLDDKTPLHIALDRKFPQVADYLLSTGKPLPPDVLFSILHSTLRMDWRAQTVCSLVGIGASVRELSTDGNTLCHTAVLTLDEYYGLNIIKLLVGVGCDPFQRNSDDKTPLHVALDRKFPLIADYLISTGKPLPSDMLFAILFNELPAAWRVQTIHSLVGKGIDVHALSADGNTLLHAAGMALGDRQALNVIKLLADCGCISSPSVRNKHGKTVFHIAAEKGSISVMEYILSLDQPLPDDILSSVLKSHAWTIPMFRLLISKGANTRLVTADGSNLLDVVITSLSHPSQPFSARRVLDMPRLLDVLIDNGCDVLASNFCGQTSLHLAVAEGYVPIVEHLLSITAPSSLPTDILACALNGKVARTNWKNTRAVFQLLIERGADIHVRAADGSTLLHIAIKDDRWLQLRMLSRRSITQKFRPISPPSSATLPPLSLVWTDNEDPCCSQPPRGTDQQSCFPPSVLGGVNLLNIIELLVDFGCDPSQCDADGRPPLYFAITKGHVDVMEYLLQKTLPPPPNLLDATELAPWNVRGQLRGVLKRWDSGV